jgi:7-cyano-7-deazaguanine tRNA-ribosyltransferase
MKLDPDTIFEIRHRSLAGRIGRIRTKSGYLETPAFFPVIDLKKQPVGISKISELGFGSVITNSYLLRKRGFEAKDIHGTLKFNKVIMTDSGAYQLLEFGKIETEQGDIIRFQEAINTDIGVILDTPTGGQANRQNAMKTVELTIRNATKLFEQKQRSDILWVGPVQGGNHLDLVECCARAIAKLPFHIHALGSPTEFLERYMYPEILTMIYTAKRWLPASRPLHLFGAGHPAVLPFFVAMGVDLFDSASYALFAKNDRYMTSYRTFRVADLFDFPCKCSVCRKFTVRELIGLPPKKRESLLAEHNLNVLANEMANIRQAIHNGTLWDILQSRRYSHPSLYRAFNFLLKHRQYLSNFSYLSTPNNSGLFSYDLDRPEFYAFRRRMKRYLQQNKYTSIVLVNEPKTKPYSTDPNVRKLVKKRLGQLLIIHPALDLVPVEFDDVYPVFQTTTEELRVTYRRIISLLKALTPTIIYVYSDEKLYKILSKNLHNVKLLRVRTENHL